MVKEIQLLVEPTRKQKDVNRGLARIGKKHMDELGVEPGDIIEIKGSKRTGAIVKSHQSPDEGRILSD